MSTLRAQFTAKPGQAHYLQWRKRVAAKLPDGGHVLLGLPGWGICPNIAAAHDTLIVPPRFLDAATKSPAFTAFLQSVAAADLISPVVYLDADDNLTFAEYSQIVYERCCKAVVATGTICLFRFVGQRGVDLARRAARADVRNYLVACGKQLPDGRTEWRARFDDSAVSVTLVEGATYRETVHALFSAFPDSVHGYASVLTAPELT